MTITCLGLPDPRPSCASIVQELFSEDQARDERGRWTVSASDVQPGDRLDPSGHTRVHAVNSRNGRTVIAWKQKGSKAPGVEGHPANEQITVYRKGEQPSGPNGETMLDRLREAGGFTIQPDTGDEPHTGYAVAIEGHSGVFDADDFLGDQAHAIELTKGWLKDNQELFDNPNVHIGGWHDTKNSKVVLDPAEVIADLDEAKKAGIARDQVAIYDLAGNEEIPTGGSGGYVAAGMVEWGDGQASTRRAREASEAGLSDDGRGTHGLRFEDRAGRQGLIQGLTVELGEGPGHPFRGNQWTDGEAEYLSRTDTDINPTTSSARASTAKAAMSAANSFIRDTGPNGGLNLDSIYWNYDEYAGYVPGTNEDGSISDTHEWIPGSPLAATESVMSWQRSYEQSRAIQGAADELLGFRTGEDAKYEGRDAAIANELLVALMGDVPEGTINPNGVSDEDGNYAEVFRANWDSADELVRGMNDDSGEIAQMYRDAQAEGRDVAFGLASFVIGGDTGDEMNANMDAMTGDDPEYDEETGEPKYPTSFDVAMKYTVAREDSPSRVLGDETAPTAAVMLKLDGVTTALNMDGGFEALTGGRFKITKIEDTEAPRPLRTNTDETIPVTVVHLEQVSLPVRP